MFFAVIPCCYINPKAAYVADTAPCAYRVVKVKLGYAAEESCRVP